ncbi:MAG: hypothetical protein ACOYON_10560 [Fimbriimonas sp.]
MALVILTLAAFWLDPMPKLRHVHTIRGDISPKSVVYAGNGLFLAQNMMYRHTITVYDRQHRLLATIPDGTVIGGQLVRGSPVEAAISPDGRYAWVSNYEMTGPGFSNPGNDRTQSRRGVFDRSYVYRVDLAAMKIDGRVLVGSVPKFVAVTPDGQTVLVSNWVSSDLSVVDAISLREVRSVYLGRFPRGIAVAPDGSVAYVALVGAVQIAVVSLSDFRVEWISNVGVSPRHLCLSADGRWLYASLNGAGQVVKIDTHTRKVVGRTAVGAEPRSMVLTPDGQRLYVVTYVGAKFCQIRTQNMEVTQVIATPKNPIGITYDPEERRVWVACYSGSIQVYGEESGQE